ncbi:MAG: rod shape-determining protein [Firmicutes bacterium]|nr:rod shape-determining protein [Bacillota bacterium]
MDFAIKMDSARTIVFKKNQGIVLNEATCIAYVVKRGEVKVVAIGNDAAKMMDRTGGDVVVVNPVKLGRIADIELGKTYFRELIKKIAGVIKPACVFVIPSTLTRDEINDWKSVVFSSNIKDAAFLPSVVTGAIELGYNPELAESALGINISEDGTDISVLSLGGIIRGGGLDEGGAKMTHAIREGIRKKFNLEIGNNMSREARNETQTLYENDGTEFLVTGIDMLTQIPRSAVLVARDTYQMTLPLYKKIAKAICQVVRQCGPDIIRDLQSGRIFVMGEGAAVVGAREFLQIEIGMNVVLNEKSVHASIMAAGKLLNNPQLLQKLVKAN